MKGRNWNCSCMIYGVHFITDRMNDFRIKCPSCTNHMSRLMTKPTKWHVRPAKTQISLGIRSVWSESSLCAQWVAKDTSFLHAGNEDTDIRPLRSESSLGTHAILLVLSRGGSHTLLIMKFRAKFIIASKMFYFNSQHEWKKTYYRKCWRMLFRAVTREI